MSSNVAISTQLRVWTFVQLYMMQVYMSGWTYIEFDICLLMVLLGKLCALTSCYPRMFVRVGFHVHSQAARGL